MPKHDPFNKKATAQRWLPAWGTENAPLTGGASFVVSNVTSPATYTSAATIVEPTPGGANG